MESATPVLNTVTITTDPLIEQTKILKRMQTMSIIRTVACVLIFAVVLSCAVIVVPQLTGFLGNLNTLIAELETAVQEVNKIDFVAMTEGVTNLATVGAESVEEALAGVQTAVAKFEEFDIDTLNKSIEDLGAVVEPMAKLFGKR